MRSKASKNAFLETLDATALENFLESQGTDDDIDNVSDLVLAKIDQNCPEDPCQQLRRENTNTLTALEQKNTELTKSSDKRKENAQWWLKKFAKSWASFKDIPDKIRDATMDPQKVEKLEKQCHAKIEYSRKRGFISDEQAQSLKDKVSQKLNENEGIAGLQSSFKDVSAGVSKGTIHTLQIS